MSTVVAAWTKVIVDYAATRGLDVRHPDVDLSRPDERVPAHVDDAIWAAALRELGDDIGLRLAESSVSVASFGVLGYLARASANVGEALVRVHDHHQLIGDGPRSELRWSPDGITIGKVPEAGRMPWPRAVTECLLASYLFQARAWSGAPVTPVEVRFQHAKPRDTRELERFFGCKLRWNAGENGLVFSRDTLAIPFATAEPILAEYLAGLAKERLAALTPASRGILDEVRAAIGAELRTGDLAIERVARRVGSTPRSLQRRLRAEGVSYRELVDTVRHARAVELVQRGVPSHAIAEALGFSEPRAFRRAFRRWTGLLPSALRSS